MRVLEAHRSILVAIALATVCGACGGAPDEDGVSDPVVLIGVDGLEWDVVLPLVRSGRMPELESLMRRGTFGTLSTHAPAKSPVIWTTVATGKPPAAHGILDFTRRAPDGQVVLYSSTDRTTKALWNILDDAGLTTSVIGWWATYPVESINGVMVAPVNTRESNVGLGLLKPGAVREGAVNQVHPPEYEADVFAMVRSVDSELPEVLADHYPEAYGSGPDVDPEAWEALSWSVRADESTLRMALRLIRGLPIPHVLLVYFGTPDVVGHKYWRYHQPEVFRYPPTPDEIEVLGNMVRHAYEQFDAALGRLLAQLPKDATVLVVSDHGMHAKKVNQRFEVGEHGHFEQASGGHGDGPPGVLVVAGPAIQRSALADRVRELSRADLPALADVVDIAPTILALRGVPIGRDMEGAVIENLWRIESPAAPTFVESHDTEEWLAAQRSRGHKLRPGEEQRLEQLRSLGYVVDEPTE
jgi:hypothetical protein